MDEVMDKVKSPGLRELIMAHKRSHESLGNEIHSELVNLNAQEKDPNPAARAMTWMKTETQYLMKPEDRTIAGLMMDGCHMGIQKLSQYENQYTAASHREWEMYVGTWLSVRSCAVSFYAQARIRKLAAGAACGPRGE